MTRVRPKDIRYYQLDIVIPYVFAIAVMPCLRHDEREQRRRKEGREGLGGWGFYYFETIFAFLPSKALSLPCSFFKFFVDLYTRLRFYRNNIDSFTTATPTVQVFFVALSWTFCRALEV